MIDKKVVPEGMLDAAMRASMEAGLGIGPSTELRVVLEAALRWQKENPPVPTDDFVEEVIREHSRTNVKWSCVEWVRRMYDAPEPEVDRIDFYIKTANGDFVPWAPTEAQKEMMGFDRENGIRPACAPEPEVPEEIKDLLAGVHPDVTPIAIEAYRRGQKSTREIFSFRFTGFKPVDHPILAEWLADAKDKGVDQATQVNYRRLFERAFEAGRKFERSFEAGMKARSE